MKRSLLTFGISRQRLSVRIGGRLQRGRRREPRPIRTFRSATATASTAAEQFSNTVSVTDPVDNKLRRRDQARRSAAGQFQSALQGTGARARHGLFARPQAPSPWSRSARNSGDVHRYRDQRGEARTTYVGRSPHEAFFTPDGKEVWVTVRGEDYVAVLDGKSFEEKTRITVPSGPGMQIFSPDGKYGYVCSSFNPETVVITVADHQDRRPGQAGQPVLSEYRGDAGRQAGLVHAQGRRQDPWCSTRSPPFNRAEDRSIPGRSPITSISRATPNGTFAYVTIGGLNEVKVFRTDDFTQVATIPVGKLPHGVLAVRRRQRASMSGWKTPMRMAAIDTATNKVIATIPIGQAPQAITLCAERRAGGRRHPGPAATRRRRASDPPYARCCEGRKPRATTMHPPAFPCLTRA